MKLCILGAGGSLPSKDRALPGLAVRRDGEIILFDCGEGTQRQFMLSNFSFMRISTIFISHFHGDHFLGLGGLIQTLGFNGRRTPLHIYGPKGIDELVQNILTLGYFPRPFEVETHALKSGETVEFDGYVVTTCRADHPVPTLAYALEETARLGRFDRKKALALGVPEGRLFRALQTGRDVTLENGTVIRSADVMGPQRRGRKIVYTSDTKPSQDIVTFAAGADVLIHDASLENKMEEFAERYGHSTSRQAADVARKAGVTTLILSHISPRYKSDDTIVLEREAQDVFPNSMLAHDLMEYEIPYPE